jgi:hypothetical protein
MNKDLEDSNSEQSDLNEDDLENYKGLQNRQENEKYFCPKTGAHFRPSELIQILSPLRRLRGDPNCEQW